MPFRLNPNRPKRFTARYRIRNWPQYEAGLKRRGDLTLWLDEAAIAGWHASRRTTPGGQALYSDLAIELVLTALSRQGGRGGPAGARAEPCGPSPTHVINSQPNSSGMRRGSTSGSRSATVMSRNFWPSEASRP